MLHIKNRKTVTMVTFVLFDNQETVVFAKEIFKLQFQNLEIFLILLQDKKAHGKDIWLLIGVTKYNSKGFPCLLNLDNLPFTRTATSQTPLHRTATPSLCVAAALFWARIPRSAGGKWAVLVILDLLKS